MYSYEDVFSDKKRVLFVMAHPDDIDVFYGGTLARLIKDQKEAFVLIMTNGALGSKDKGVSPEELAKIRLEEQKEAFKIMGLPLQSFRISDHHDGEIEDSLEIIGEVAREIRRFRPDIVCTQNTNGFYLPSVKVGRHFINHRDHRNTGLATLDAIYPFSRDRSFFPEQIQEGLSPHSVLEVVVADRMNDNLRVDLTSVIEQKRKALLSHQSQFSRELVEEILSEMRE